MSPLRVLTELARWCCGFWLLWRVPRLGSVPERPRPELAVIVPARNEAPVIGRLLGSLSGETVIVVDDGSTDGTADVARRFGVDVVTAPPLPDGWTGKCWACATGADRASGATLLVFLDADTRVHPGGLDRLAAAGLAAGGLLSVQPYHVTERPYETLSAFFNVIAMMGVGAFTPRSRPPRGAFGPCLVTSTADYRRAGGHAAVRGEILDDVALARKYAEAGLPVTVLGGRGTVDFRMYADGIGQLVEGWSKNFASGAVRTSPITLILIVAWLSGCISAPFTAWGSWAGAAVYAVYAAQLAVLFGRVGRFPRWVAVLYPLPLAGFLAVFLRSLVSTFIGRGVPWKGRRVKVGIR